MTPSIRWYPSIDWSTPVRILSDGARLYAADGGCLIIYPDKGRTVRFIKNEFYDHITPLEP